MCNNNLAFLAKKFRTDSAWYTMTSKKGLSEAEKRTRMSEIFLSVSNYLFVRNEPSNVAKGEFYTFKEIEKIATQQKKIVLQSVKEVLQSLVDDRLVRYSFDTFFITTLVHVDRSRPIKSALASTIGRFHPMPKELDK